MTEPAAAATAQESEAPLASHATHEVLNQPPPLENCEPLSRRPRPCARRSSARAAASARSGSPRFGADVGTRRDPRAAPTMPIAIPPELTRFDRFGHRIDEVEFHPAWHELMALAVAHRRACLAWAEPRPGAHVARAALAYPAVPERGRRELPDGDDLSPACRRCACQPESPPNGSRASRAHATIRASFRPRAEDRRAHRHGDDRKAGRLGRARQHDARRAEARRGPGDDIGSTGPQMVLLRAHVGRLPGARPRPRAGSPASSCRAGCPTASVTHLPSSA